MFWVLVFSTALAALVLFGAWLWNSDDLASTAPNNARQPADAQAFSTADPAARQTPADQTSGPPNANN
jgi:hypothetical protein